MAQAYIMQRDISPATCHEFCSLGGVEDVQRLIAVGLRWSRQAEGVQDYNASNYTIFF